MDEIKVAKVMNNFDINGVNNISGFRNEVRRMYNRLIGSDIVTVPFNVIIKFLNIG